MCRKLHVAAVKGKQILYIHQYIIANGSPATSMLASSICCVFGCCFDVMCVLWSALLFSGRGPVKPLGQLH